MDPPSTLTASHSLFFYYIFTTESWQKLSFVINTGQLEAWKPAKPIQSSIHPSITSQLIWFESITAPMSKNCKNRYRILKILEILQLETETERHQGIKKPDSGATKNPANIPLQLNPSQVLINGVSTHLHTNNSI